MHGIQLKTGKNARYLKIGKNARYSDALFTLKLTLWFRFNTVSFSTGFFFFFFSLLFIVHYYLVSRAPTNFLGDTSTFILGHYPASSGMCRRMNVDLRSQFGGRRQLDQHFSVETGR